MASISKDTLSFLKDLAKNNNRDWFAQHKSRYTEAKDNAVNFANILKDQLSHHDDIEGAKVMRIYRDVRFSKDKTPYKNSIGIGFKRATSALRGGMYIHIQAGQSFVGGGFWGPNSEDLKRIRQEIDLNAAPFRNIQTSKTFKEYFGELKGERLKSSPRGYDKEHPNLDLLQLKQYLLSREFTDKEVKADNFLSECNKTFKAMRPFFDLMSITLTTDANGESIL